MDSKEKWDAIRAKINDSSCHIVCLQETKRDNFDQLYLKKFCTKQLNSFAFFPSVGASGGIITIWNNNVFSRDVFKLMPIVLLSNLLTGLTTAAFF